MISEPSKTTLLGIIIGLSFISLLLSILLVKLIFHTRRSIAQNRNLPTQSPSIQHPPTYTSYPTAQEVRIPTHGDEPPDYHGRTNRTSLSSISSVSEPSVIFIDNTLRSATESPTHSTSSNTLFEHPSELQLPIEEVPPSYRAGASGLRQSVDSAREFYASFYAPEIYTYRRITPPLPTSYPIPRRLSASLVTNHSHRNETDVESQNSMAGSQWTFGVPVQLEDGSDIADGVLGEG